MKYRHYAPKAPVTAVTGDPAHSALVIWGLLREKAGVICFDEFAGYFEGHIVHRLGLSTDKLAQAQRVFDALRTFDGTDVTEIFAQCPDDAGLGLAVGNRLKKAAGFHLIDGDAPVVIGITGGTGSGKTSALQALETLGGTVLDCDAVYHQALREDEALCSRIRDAFGEVFRGTELDRQKLGSLVFSDPQALERLNGIIFDYLPGVLRRRMEGKVLVGLDAINLMESGWGNCAAGRWRYWPPASSGFGGSCSGTISRRSTHGCAFRPRSRTAIIVSTAQMCWKSGGDAGGVSGRRRRFFSGICCGSSTISPKEDMNDDR